MSDSEAAVLVVVLVPGSFRPNDGKLKAGFFVSSPSVPTADGGAKTDVNPSEGTEAGTDDDDDDERVSCDEPREDGMSGCGARIPLFASEDPELGKPES